MDKAQRIIESPLSYLRPTWRGAMVYAILFAIVAGAVTVVMNAGRDHRPAPQQPANR